MVEKVLCKLQPAAGDTMIDLGCGDARWLIEASQRFGCKCVGIELDEVLVATSGLIVMMAFGTRVFDCWPNRFPILVDDRGLLPPKPKEKEVSVGGVPGPLAMAGTGLPR